MRVTSVSAGVMDEADDEAGEAQLLPGEHRWAENLLSPVLGLNFN